MELTKKSTKDEEASAKHVRRSYLNPAYDTDTNEIIGKNEKMDEKEKVVMCSIGKLFSYSTSCDIFMIFLAILASIGTGLTWPLLFLVFGDTTDNLVSFQYYLTNMTGILKKNNVTITDSPSLQTVLKELNKIIPNYTLPNEYNIMKSMETVSMYFAAIALGMFILSYFSLTFLVISSQRQVAAIRKALFRAIMRQNIGWYDTQSSGALNNKLIDEVATIEQGIGDKLGQMFQWFVVGIAGLIMAFVKGWKLTLVVLSISPVIGSVTFIMSVMMSKLNQSEMKAYGKAGAIAEEVLGAIRTVASFRGEEYEANRYSSNLDNAAAAGTKKGALTGMIMGLFNGLMFLSYSLGFWYGAKLIRENYGEMTTGRMLIIFFCCVMSSMGLGQALPHFNTLNRSRVAASGIFDIIDRVPEIDKMNPEGIKSKNMKGEITLESVAFRYPTRSECPVLVDLSVEVKSGQTVALVGSSGCGKSSIIQLIQRFYDVENGKILIDGVNIREYNLKWLREQIGVVSQEPVLFGCTIRENIEYGRMDVREEEIQKACEMANAVQFIEKLPLKLDTIVGDRGAQLSGGQKQRIAIARALVRNPKILLLDEATSALDTESERIVQEALDKACAGRTTIIIAHRLSTVRNADKIFGIRDGRVLESGTHGELLNLEDGLYRDLVMRQQMKEYDETKDEQNFEEIVSEDNVISGEQRKQSILSNKDVEIVDKTKKSNTFFRVMALNGPEKCFIILGCIGAIFNGASQPGFAVIFGYVVPAMGNSNAKEQEENVSKFVIAMAGIGVAIFLANVVQSYFFAKSGERLTKTCRILTFKAMLRQNIAWFDEPENNLGSLTTKLSSEASAIRGTSGENLGTFFQAVFSMGAGIIISFIYTWHISLLILAFIPILLLGGFLQVKLMQGPSGSDKASLEESGKVAVESIENFRTVTNLTLEETFIGKYNEVTSGKVADVSKKAHVRGLLYALSQATIFAAYAAVFMLSGYLITNSMVNVESIFIAFGALMFGAMYLGNTMAMAPQYSKGKVAAENMFTLLDRVPEIDSYSTSGVPLNRNAISGKVTLDGVYFTYPLRPTIVVLKEFSVEVEPNTTVALVGSSGCGKSTIIQLLQRFYEYKKGDVLLENTSIRDIKIQSLRDSFSIVSQEPTLFSCTVRENIAYADELRSTTLVEIEEAAKSANIHDFIMSLPEKYDTKIGEKGGNLSGGQKQRIAIARALLRKPKILLLDEATSALDTESEKIVQDALDRAQQGRTCIVIAHRLSTIQNADKIVVLKEGKIAEIGNHGQLMNKQNGIYSKMVKAQNKNN